MVKKTLIKVGGSCQDWYREALLKTGQGDETSPGNNPSNIENGGSVKLVWQGSS